MGSGSGLIQLIRQQAKDQVTQGLELATVVKGPPGLIIRVDNMSINLDGDDLLICAHLLPAPRYAHISNDPGPPPAEVSYNRQTYQQSGDEISTQHTRVAFQDNALEPGDKIVVLALPSGKQYLIIDKVVQNG